MPPTSTGLIVWAADPASWMPANTRPRASIGYWSASSGACTANWFDFVIPAPIRVRNSVSALNARPDSITVAANTTLAHATTRVRRKRSASHPIGTAPNTRKAPDAELMNTIAPLLMCSESRMSGDKRAERGALEVVERDERRRASRTSPCRPAAAPRAARRRRPPRRAAPRRRPSDGRRRCAARPPARGSSPPAGRRARRSSASVNGYFACSNALVEAFHSYT